MADTIRRAMSTPQWYEQPQPEARAWLLLMALCEALHPLGAVSVPSPDQVDVLTDRMLRDEAIWQAFDGRNYAELAAKHHLTERQVRRIVERMRGRQKVTPSPDSRS